MRTNLPLPSEATLKRWMAKIDCSPGFQEIVFEILKQKAKTFEISEKLCVLIFDEIDICKKPCYSQSADKVFGPFSKCQVVLLRGLCSSWKQPIFFGFDLTFHKEKFLEILQKIQKVGLIPIGSVCDYSPSNRGLLKELNISPENPSFSDISFKNPVLFFADMPHMLKLLRNHLLDQGLFLNSGYFFSKAIFSKILKSDNKELKICHKISAFHLNLHGSDRQNVRKASQLFSNTVGNFLLQFFPEENEGAKFILLIDCLFDLFNSVQETDRRNPNKNSFSGEADQILLLNTSLNEIQNIRVGKTNCSSPSPRKSLLPFQLGFIQSINALKKLYEYISINFEIRYILTYKLTQDSLENFFYQVRSLGHGYNNPSGIYVQISNFNFL